MLCPFSRSHPTGVRGLKCVLRDPQTVVGAVAPHWGAWIEIGVPAEGSSAEAVAPHWGAWIEILRLWWFLRQQWSHPTGVRGLKFTAHHLQLREREVAPHWGAWIEILAP